MSCCDKKQNPDTEGQAKKTSSTPWWRNGHNLMMAGCVAIMGYAIFGAGAENSSWLSYLVLLACPLMHILMMRAGHGCHKDGNKKGDKEDSAEVKPRESASDSVRPIPIEADKPQQIRREF